MSLQIVIGVMIIIFVANFVKSAIGFGSGLVAMPLLSLLIGVKTAAPMFALMALVGSLIIVFTNRRDIDIPSAARLLAASLFGIPFGLYMLSSVPEVVVLTILGIILVMYGLYNLLSLRLPVLKDDRMAYPAGFLGGILGGAYNTAGPPVVVYATLKNWKPDHFRATMQTYFLLITIPIAFGHMLTGLWVTDVFVYCVASIVPMLTALYVGDRLHHRIPQAVFSRIVYVFLVVIGVLLVI